MAPPSVSTAALAAVVLAALAPSARAADCPQGSVIFNSGPTAPIAAAVFDTVLTEDRAASFDLPAGTLRLRHVGKFGSALRAVDTYTIGGLPAGTPVSIVVEFDVMAAIWTPGCGGSNCWGGMAAQVTRGTDVATGTAYENVFMGSRAVPRLVELPLVFLAGQPETIEFALGGSGSTDHRTDADGAIRFRGLPHGASITSCHGYADAPTPAHGASWGEVKATYR